MGLEICVGNYHIRATKKAINSVTHDVDMAGIGSYDSVSTCIHHNHAYYTGDYARQETALRVLGRCFAGYFELFL